MGTERNSIAHKLYLSDFLREPSIRSAIQALQLPSGSRDWMQDAGLAAILCV